MGSTWDGTLHSTSNEEMVEKVNKLRPSLLIRYKENSCLLAIPGFLGGLSLLLGPYLGGQHLGLDVAQLALDQGLGS